LRTVTGMQAEVASRAVTSATDRKRRSQDISPPHLVKHASQ
jgi:hypothetical protein